MESVGIKESMELLKGIELLLIDYKNVMADGKVDLRDLSVVGEIMGQFAQLSEAAKGINQIGKELSDLDESEIMLLASAALSIVRAFKQPAA